MTTDKATILASIAANGLKQIGKNEWTDATHAYSIIRKGNRYEVECKRTAPWPGMNIAVREALRPIFLTARAEGRA